MNRCLELAAKGAGRVAPNPMVGAVLVHEQRIIGEGWHRVYGHAHAEVNCLAAVKPEDEALISSSTMYVSLEPCAHFGKTPPCADLLIKNRVPKVVIACRDPFEEVNGKGMEKLRAAGIEVEHPILEESARELNRRFFTFHLQQRPYIILKWAQTADGYIDAENGARLQISNELSNRLVHKWRSEEAAILVGKNTARLDNPELSNRLWTGNSPLRLVIDPELELPSDLKLFQDLPTVIFNCKKEEQQGLVRFKKLESRQNMLTPMLQELYKMNIQSVLVEGGARTHQLFIDANLWDEARVISNSKLLVGKGISAASLPVSIQMEEFSVGDDNIHIFRNPSSLAHLKP